MPRQAVSRLILPASMDSLQPLLAYSGELARQIGFDKKEALEINLALEELFANVVEHALIDDDQAQCDVIFEQMTTGLRVTIREKGLPFDPSKVPQYSPDKASLDMDIRGLGSFLAARFVKELHFANLGKDGKETSFVKYLGKQHVQPDAMTDESENSEVKRVDVKGFEVRLLKPDESIEAAKCAYKSYRYSYADYIYYPERIAQMIEEGRLIAVVAVTDDGTFMGYGDWEFPCRGAPIAESSILVSPEFRHTRAAFRIMKELFEQARMANLHYGHAFCVTSHTLSQKGTALFGGVDTGLLLGMLPADLEFRDLVGQASQRESLVCNIIPFKHTDPRTLHPPAAHHDIIVKIHEALGLPDSIVAATDKTLDDVQLRGQSRLMLERTPDTNTAIIRVLGYGADILQEVHGQLRACCLDKIDVIQLHLNLEDELTALLTPEFEQMGFFFAGLFPLGLQGKTALMLQYLNNIHIDPGLLQVHSSLGKALLEYVSGQIPDLTTDAKEAHH